METQDNQSKFGCCFFFFNALIKKNVLEYQEINEFLGDTHFTPEQIEKIYEFLEKN